MYLRSFARLLLENIFAPSSTNLLITETLGTLSLVHTPSQFFSNLSLICQENKDGFSCLYAITASITRGVRTVGLLPIQGFGRQLPVSLYLIKQYFVIKDMLKR